MAARRIESELDENRYIEPSKEIFSTYVENWFITHYQNRIKQTTASNRRYILEKHLLRENPFVNKEISKITTEDIDSLYNLKLDQDYSTSYIRKIHQMLMQAFNQAVRWKKIAANPVAESDPPSVKTREMAIWSFNDITEFLNKCKGERHYLTFIIALYTGMRREEILGLKWSDIDFNKESVYVNRSLAYVPKIGYIFTSLKTKNSKRQISIPKFVVKELRAHKKLQEDWKELVGDLYEDQDLVICTNTGSMQDPRNVNRVLKRIVKDAKVSNIRFHDIRHTHASILISEGIDIVKISNRLGHANPKITFEYYAHLLPNSDNDVAEIFHEAIQGRVNNNHQKSGGQMADI